MQQGLTSPRSDRAIKKLLRKVRQERGQLALYIGYAVRLRLVRMGDQTETRVEPVLLYPVEDTPDDPLDDAMELMAGYRVRRLPVVIDMQLVGVLAQADVAQEAKDKQAGQVLEAISQDSTDKAESVGVRG